jgi:hypothetical protein
MAFLIENDQVISFAEFQDVLTVDQRIFEANEGLSDELIDRALVRATERILVRFRNTAWWRNYYRSRSNGQAINSQADIPALDPNLIKDRFTDFTELCVYTALSETVLPGIADFSDEDSAERQKMSYYEQRASALFIELVQAGDWYDFDDDGVIQSTEKQPGQLNLKRVR